MELKKYKLGEIATIYNGSTPSTSDESNYDGDIVWATPKDLSDQQSKYFIKGARNITQKGFKSCSTQIIPANNILMSSRAPIGLFAINKVDCCTNQGFKSIVLDKSKADVDFMYYYLKFHVSEIVALGTGTTFKEVSKSSFEKYEISIPDLNIQKSISSVLSNLDRKIALNRAINRNLESLAKQLYDYWFVQFDFPDENGRPYKSSGGKMVWNEKLKREIPVGWENENMEAFLTIKNGRDHKHLASGNFPVYGSGGEMRRVSEYLYNGESVLMPRKGSLNNIMYVNRSFWTVDTMYYSEMKIPHCAKYVFYTIKDIDFTRWDSGTGVPSMTASTLYSIPMVKPNNVILQRFDNALSPLFQKLEQAQLENEGLIKQRDKLLPLLMNGQVEVKRLNSDL